MNCRRLAPGFALLAAIAIAGCRDKVRFESAGDVVGDSSYRRLDYEVTSDRYQKWIAAHRALDGVEVGEPVRVDLRNLTSADIDRVQQSLENHAAARAAITGAGISVRDFVLTTIALAQPWAESTGGASSTVDVADPGPTVAQRDDPPSDEARSSDDDDRDSWSGRSGGKGKKKKHKRGH